MRRYQLATLRSSMTSGRGLAVIEIVLVASVALALTLLLLVRTEIVTPNHPDFSRPQDLQQYIQMALHGPLDYHIGPFGWRIGTPLLVSWLPLHYVDSFLLVAVTSLWWTAVTIYYLVKAFSFPSTVAFTGMVGFLALGWAVKFHLHNFWLTEPPAFLLLTVGMLALAKGRLVVASGAMALGSLFRETAFVLAPLFYTMRARRLVDARAAIEALLLVAPTVIVLVAIRLLIPAWNHVPEYVSTMPSAIQYVVENAVPSLGLQDIVERSISVRLEQLDGAKDVLSVLFFSTVGVYGIPITSLIVLGGITNVRLLGRIGLLLIVPYVQVVIATSAERLYVVGFPAAIVLAAAGVSYLMQRLHVSYMPFLIAAFGLYALQLTDPTVTVLHWTVQLAVFIAATVLVFASVRISRRLAAAG